MRSTQEGELYIRTMTRDDINAVLALDRKIGAGKSVLSYTDLDIANPGGPADLSLVAEINNVLIGFVIARLLYLMIGFMMARLEYLMIPFTEICVIHGMLIDPVYQGQRIGSRLNEKLFELCKAKGINTIRTLVPERDETLRQFVEYHGFRRSTQF